MLVVVGCTGASARDVATVQEFLSALKEGDAIITVVENIPTLLPQQSTEWDRAKAYNDWAKAVRSLLFLLKQNMSA